jgi:predicted fused transcriptional regulator/phosphomethylpyrimidine kinase
MLEKKCKYYSNKIEIITHIDNFFPKIPTVSWNFVHCVEHNTHVLTEDLVNHYMDC